MSDIGPGDVVECVEHVLPWVTITAGQRYTVLHVERGVPGCPCGEPDGIDLVELGRDQFQTYCLGGFRKIGGSKSDTIARFAQERLFTAPDDKGKIGPGCS